MRSFRLDLDFLTAAYLVVGESCVKISWATFSVYLLTSVFTRKGAVVM